MSSFCFDVFFVWFFVFDTVSGCYWVLSVRQALRGRVKVESAAPDAGADNHAEAEHGSLPLWDSESGGSLLDGESTHVLYDRSSENVIKQELPAIVLYPSSSSTFEQRLTIGCLYTSLWVVLNVSQEGSVFYTDGDNSVCTFNTNYVLIYSYVHHSNASCRVLLIIITIALSLCIHCKYPGTSPLYLYLYSLKCMQYRRAKCFCCQSSLAFDCLDCSTWES